jgi:hypothetical protein
MAEFLSEYPTLRTVRADFADFLLIRVLDWIEKPDIVLAPSVTNQILWGLLTKELGLSARANAVRNRGDIMAEVSAKRIYFDRFSEDWWKSPDFPNVLSASIDEGQGFDLRFLDQTELRQVIIEDFQEARRAYDSRSYKATLVLCGSILEALLVASLAKASSGVLTEDDLSKTSLEQLIKKADEGGLIKDDALLGLLNPLRSYRNLIHPGRQLRTQIQPDEHRAQIALRTVRLLVDQLRRAFASP